MRFVSNFLKVIALLSVVAPLSGCGPKDVDPHAKVDAPGYYNGPMKGQVKGADKPKGQISDTQATG